MVEARRVLGLVLCTAMGAFGCTSEGESAIDVGVAREALNGCDETVPATRFIDGIPSYAQCATTMSSAIYSNNGVDTATTSMGAGWVRTQYSGGYQCTELAHRYLHFKWNVKWIPNGNAGAWCDTQPPANSGVVQTMAPVHGDVMVLAPGSCGADGTTGHVTVVDIVDAAKQKLTVLEQNGARRGMYNQSCAKCFLHVVANDGTNQGQPITGAPATGAAGTPAAAGAPAPAQTAGAEAPGKRPAPQAGSAAPTPPSMPAPTPPPTVPVAPPAAPATAGSPAPAPAAAPTQSVKAGASAPVPTVTPAASDRSSEAEGGCSVTQVRGSAGSGGLFALGLGLVVLRLRRRRDAR